MQAGRLGRGKLVLIFPGKNDKTQKKLPIDEVTQGPEDHIPLGDKELFGVIKEACTILKWMDPFKREEASRHSKSHDKIGKMIKSPGFSP